MDIGKTYIKLYRSSLKNPLFLQEPFDKWHAWEDILLNANFGYSEKLYKGSVQNVDPGQWCVSISTLSARWKWSENKVRRYLKMLESLKMCSISSTNSGTLITVLNWFKYQQPEMTLKTDGTPILQKNQKNGRADGRADGRGASSFESVEISRFLESAFQERGTPDGRADGRAGGRAGGTHKKKNKKKNKNNNINACARAREPLAHGFTKEEWQVGEVWTDEDGFTFIKLPDGHIDRYRESDSR